jgi:hypothetical protein
MLKIDSLLFYKVNQKLKQEKLLNFIILVHRCIKILFDLVIIHIVLNNIIAFLVQLLSKRFYLFFNV